MMADGENASEVVGPENTMDVVAAAARRAAVGQVFLMVDDYAWSAIC